MDFALAYQVFEGLHYTLQDTRIDYGEARYVTIGYMKKRLVVLAWTPRGQTKRIISMRKANEREQKRFKQYL